MYRIALSMFLLAGEALAHPRHGAPAQHLHGWEYALLVAAIAAAVAGWIARRK
jgi:hypothetical protein